MFIIYSVEKDLSSVLSSAHDRCVLNRHTRSGSPLPVAGKDGDGSGAFSTAYGDIAGIDTVFVPFLKQRQRAQR